MNNHRALIVEDERDMAAEIGDLLGSMGYDHVAIDNLADGRRLLDEGEFCFVLLDLQIKAEKFSIRPRVEAGMTFLRDLRQKHPRRGENDMHLLPVIVVSGQPPGFRAQVFILATLYPQGLRARAHRESGPGDLRADRR